MTCRCEQGMALVIVLMSMVLLSTIGAGLVLITSAETAIAGNAQSAAEAVFAADTMLARSLRDLRVVPDWTAVLDGSVASPFVDGSVSGTRTLGGGRVLNLYYVASEAGCHQTSCSATDLNAVTAERPWGPNNPRWRVFACGPLANLLGAPSSDSGLYVVALVADDGSENDGDPALDGISVGGNPNPGLGILEVRAEAFGANGVHRAVQATVSRYQTAEVGVGTVTEVRTLAWREVQ